MKRPLWTSWLCLSLHELYRFTREVAAPYACMCTGSGAKLGTGPDFSSFFLALLFFQDSSFGFQASCHLVERFSTPLYTFIHISRVNVETFYIPECDRLVCGSNSFHPIRPSRGAFSCESHSPLPHSLPVCHSN